MLMRGKSQPKSVTLWYCTIGILGVDSGQISVAFISKFMLIIMEGPNFM